MSLGAVQSGKPATLPLAASTKAILHSKSHKSKLKEARIIHSVNIQGRNKKFKSNCPSATFIKALASQRDTPVLRRRFMTNSSQSSSRPRRRTANTSWSSCTSWSRQRLQASTLNWIHLRHQVCQLIITPNLEYRALSSTNLIRKYSQTPTSRS